MKKVLILFFFSFFFISCSHKNIDGTSNLHSMIANAVEKSKKKYKKNINLSEDVVLVTDFVNLEKLKNKSRLAFLLTDILKDRLSNLDIIVRQVEFSKNFELSQGGLNILTRDVNKIITKSVNAKHAIVGTYSITTKRLNIFIKLIELETGNILASSYESIRTDKEMLLLEGKDEMEEARRNTRPRVVL